MMIFYIKFTILFASRITEKFMHLVRISHHNTTEERHLYY